MKNGKEIQPNQGTEITRARYQAELFKLGLRHNPDRTINTVIEFIEKKQKRGPRGPQGEPGASTVEAHQFASLAEDFRNEAENRERASAWHARIAEESAAAAQKAEKNAQALKDEASRIRDESALWAVRAAQQADRIEATRNEIAKKPEDLKEEQATPVAKPSSEVKPTVTPLKNSFEIAWEKLKGEGKTPVILATASEKALKGDFDTFDKKKAGQELTEKYDKSFQKDKAAEEREKALKFQPTGAKKPETMRPEETVSILERINAEREARKAKEIADRKIEPIAQFYVDPKVKAEEEAKKKEAQQKAIDTLIKEAEAKRAQELNDLKQKLAQSEDDVKTLETKATELAAEVLRARTEAEETRKSQEKKETPKAPEPEKKRATEKVCPKKEEKPKKEKKENLWNRFKGSCGRAKDWLKRHPKVSYALAAVGGTAAVLATWATMQHFGYFLPVPIQNLIIKAGEIVYTVNP